MTGFEHTYPWGNKVAFPGREQFLKMGENFLESLRKEHNGNSVFNEHIKKIKKWKI